MSGIRLADENDGNDATGKPFNFGSAQSEFGRHMISAALIAMDDLGFGRDFTKLDRDKTAQVESKRLAILGIEQEEVDTTRSMLVRRTNTPKRTLRTAGPNTCDV